MRPTPTSRARSSSASDLLLPWKISRAGSTPATRAVCSSPPDATSTSRPSSSTSCSNADGAPRLRGVGDLDAGEAGDVAAAAFAQVGLVDHPQRRAVVAGEVGDRDTADVQRRRRRRGWWSAARVAWSLDGAVTSAPVRRRAAGRARWPGPAWRRRRASTGRDRGRGGPRARPRWARRRHRPRRRSREAGCGTRCRSGGRSRPGPRRSGRDAGWRAARRPRRRSAAAAPAPSAASSSAGWSSAISRRRRPRAGREPALVRGPQQRADPRVGVLDVVDGVLHRLPRRRRRGRSRPSSRGSGAGSGSA